MSMALFSRPRRDAQPDADIVADARTIETVLLRALANASQTDIARASGISDTRLSRFKNAATDGGGLWLQEVANVLAALGLSVIDARPSDLITMPAERAEALRVLARSALDT